MIRAFVGIPLPAEITRSLAALQAGLPAGRPVAPENFHLTIAFLGEHPSPLIEDVHLALDRLRVPSFELSLAGLGFFGGPRPRVFFAEVAPQPTLKHLHEKVVQAARGAGIPLERQRYSPHVTLARFRGGLVGEQAEEMRSFAVSRLGFRAGPFRVEEFVLFRSHLGRNGPIYEALAEYPLNGEAHG